MSMIKEVIVINDQMDIIINDVGFSINDKIDYQILVRENGIFTPLIQDEYTITDTSNIDINIVFDAITHDIIVSNLLKIIVQFNNLEDNKYINNTTKKMQNKILIKQIEDNLSLELENLKKEIEDIDVSDQISNVLEIIYNELLPLVDEKETNTQLIQDILNSIIKKLLDCQEQINLINHYHLETQIKLNELRHSLKFNISKEIYSYKFILEILFYLLKNGISNNKTNQKLNNHVKIINTNINYIAEALELINNKLN